MFFRKLTSFILLFILIFSKWIGNFMVYALTPNDITNKVFFLDWQDTDADWNSGNEPVNNSQITNLIDKFNSNTWSQIISAKQPLYQTNSINSYPSLYFDWTNDLLDLKDNLEISVWTWYTEKSYVMIIKTGSDVNTFQTIYDEATKEKWFSFQIEAWKLYAWTFNTLDWTSQNRTIDMWNILANEIYTIIFVYSKNGDFIKAYLNWTLVWTLNTIETQVTHWACTFETSFNCNIYSTWWALAIWATKNDVLKLSNSTVSTWLEKDFFKGNIWEISSYNYALNVTEVSWLNDYLFTKWWFDTIAPVINSTNFSNNDILPWGNHNIVFNYSDTWVWATWIDISTANPYFEKWNSGTSIWENITVTWLNAGTITTSQASYPTNSLDFWKYRINFNISDNAWNTSSNSEIIFYIDKPQLIISTWSVDIWILNTNTNSFANTITVTVKTVWAPFNLKLKRNQTLTDGSDTIPYYNWTLWFGYDKNNDSNLFDFNNSVIGQEILNINTNWNLNIYTYTVKIWAIIDFQQQSGDYSWKIDFWIELDY